MIIKNETNRGTVNQWIEGFVFKAFKKANVEHNEIVIERFADDANLIWLGADGVSCAYTILLTDWALDESGKKAKVRYVLFKINGSESESLYVGTSTVKWN